MCNLIVNTPTGEQKIIQIKETGSYFDLSKVIWDERKDGLIPEVITLGKMIRKGKALETSPDYLPEHAAFLTLVQARADQQAKKAQIDAVIKNDTDLASLRGMSDIEIDAWFAANVLKVDQASKLLNKIVKALVKQNLL